MSSGEIALSPKSTPSTVKRLGAFVSTMTGIVTTSE